MKLSLSHDEEKIYFENRKYSFLGYSTFDKDFWDWISRVSWTVSEKAIMEGKKTYIRTNNKEFSKHSSLHQSAMVHWYGLDKFLEARENKFIVEHHNNIAFDCTIKNLSFAPNNLNLAKAHTFDKTQPDLVKKVGVNFFKDFSSGQYQITLIFTDDYYLLIDEECIQIERLYLVYDDNFRVVYHDANRIVDELLENQRINLKLLSYKKMRFEEAILYKTTEGENITGVRLIQDDTGKTVIVVGDDAKDKFFFNSINPDENLY